MRWKLRQHRRTSKNLLIAAKGEERVGGWLILF
jgi:hypothetical protein